MWGPYPSPAAVVNDGGRRIERVRRPSRRQLQRVADYAIPWGVGIFLVLVVLDEHDARGFADGLALLALALAVVQALALRWRRRRPEAATAVVLAAGLGYWLIVPEIVISVAGLFAIGSLAAARPPRVSLVGLLALVALTALNFATTTAEDTQFSMGLVVVAWALGEVLRSQRTALREETRRAVSEEQARIARELHDVIAHSVSVIVVQASAAVEVFDRRPDQARAALGSIERAGRDALGELRRLLGAVRPAGEGADPTAPQPGLDRLDELVAPLRASGLVVAVRREGTPRELPAGVELSAYRIVQEALTNALRHAHATRVDARVAYGDDAIEVEVRDDGRGAASGGGSGGHGLVGMRERAALLGGTLEAGPAPSGGYRVHARLPLEAAT
jgi:signal transduction histidine kinase